MSECAVLEKYKTKAERNMVDFKFKFRMHGTFGISPYGIPAKTSLGSPYGLERHVGCPQRGVPPTKTADNSKNKKIRTRIQKRYARSRDWKGAWTNENPNKLRPGKITHATKATRARTENKTKKHARKTMERAMQTGNEKPAQHDVHARHESGTANEQQRQRQNKRR